MTPFLATWILAAPALLGALGVGLLAHTGLQTAVAVVQGLRRRWGGRFTWLTDEEGTTVGVGHRRLTLSWTALLPFFGGLGLAVLWRQLILSVGCVILGAAATVLTHLSKPPATADERALEEVFLAAFRSRYAVSHSLGAALRGAAEDIDVTGDHPLSQAVAQTGQLLYAGEPLEAALRPLADHSPVLKRLTTILARSNLAAQAETQELLASLEEQARQSRRLAERAQVALTVVRLTLRVLVTANTVALALPSVLPTWRRHYLAHPLPYGVGSGLALAGYSYFRFKIKTLEEKL